MDLATRLDQLLDLFGRYSEAVATLRLMRDLRSSLAVEQEAEVDRLYPEFLSAAVLFVDQAMPDAGAMLRAQAENRLYGLLMAYRKTYLRRRYATIAGVEIGGLEEADGLRKDYLAFLEEHAS